MPAENKFYIFCISILTVSAAMSAAALAILATSPAKQEDQRIAEVTETSSFNSSTSSAVYPACIPSPGPTIQAPGKLLLTQEWLNGNKVGN